MQKLSQAPENQPLIKNLSSTFPCLCCDREHLYLELEANDFWYIAAVCDSLECKSKRKRSFRFLVKASIPREG